MPNKTTQGSNPTAADVSTAARDITERARNAAASVTDAAGDAAAAIDERRSTAADGLDTAASALYDRADDLPGAKPSATLRARQPIDSAPAPTTSAVTIPSA